MVKVSRQTAVVGLAVFLLALGNGSASQAEYWRKISGPVATFLQNSSGEYAIKLPDKDIYERLPDNARGETRWRKIGGPGAAFAVTKRKLYGLTPSRDAVYEYSGTPHQWRQVGGPARAIYAGDSGLFATHPDTGDLWAYNLNYYDPGQPRFHPGWTRIGGPGAMFAVGQHLQPYDYPRLFGLAPDKQSVWLYEHPMKWKRVGGPARRIMASGKALYALDPDTGSIFGWHVKLGDGPSRSEWVALGGPGVHFSTYTLAHGLYAVGLDHRVRKFDATEWPSGRWVVLGGSNSPRFDRVYVGPAFSVRARERGSKNLWALEPGNPPQRDRRPPSRPP